jgi:hypothetical protein
MSNVFVFRQLPPGVINEYFGGGGKGGTTTSSQTVSIPPEVLARYNAVNAQAETVAQQPFQQYGGEFVAPLTPTQVAGTNATNAASSQAQPYYGAATALTLGGAQNVGPLTQGQIGYYQNPYTQAVVNPTVQALQQQQGQQLSQQQAEAIKGGAFGGDRANLQRSQLQGQQNLALGQAIAPLYQQGYGQAVQTAQGQQGVIASDLARQMQAGQQVAGLGTAAQAASLQGAQAQLAAGQVGQQTQQAQDTAQYQQFLQERGYPFQVAQFLANIAMGTGALSGSTTSGTQTSPGGFFSDKRLKNDVKEIGETHDGQPIYSYKYNGDDRTQIGLMAQDVEKKHPDAVGLMGGYKTVDYKKATEGAERTHKDMGGGLMPDGFDPNSMGGAVTMDMAGEGFERGGYVGGGLVDSNDWAQIVAANKQALGVYGGQQPMGGAPGATGIVPAATIYVPKPIEAAKMSMPAQRPSGLSTAMQTGKDIAGAYKGGKDFLLGSKDASGKDVAGLIGGGGSTSGQSWGGELKDWWNTPSAAHGGLIVPRHEYALGGDIPGGGDTSYVPDERPDVGALKAKLTGGQQAPLPGSGGGGGGLGSMLMLGSHLEGLMGGQKPSGFAGLLSGDSISPFAFGGLARNHYAAGGGDDSLGDEAIPYDPSDVTSGKDPMEGVVKSGMQKHELLKPGELHMPEPSKKNPVGGAMKGASAGMAFGPWGALAGGVLGGLSEMNAGGAVRRQAFQQAGLVLPDVPADYSPEADMPSPNAQEAGLVVDQPDRSLPRSVRNNNPGNIEASPWAQKQQGYVGSDGRFAIFEKPEHGASAMDNLLVGYANRGLMTPASIIGRWSPTSDPGNAPGSTSNYAQHVAKKLGVGPDDRIDMSDPNIRSTLASAMAEVEGGTRTGKPTANVVNAPRPPGVMGGTDVRATPSGAEGKKSIGDVVTSEGFIVPALGFLGSMLASDKRNLGQALGEGIMGGVGAYQSQRKMAAEIPKVEAQTELEKARTGEVQQTTKNLRSGMYVVSQNVLGELQLYDKENPTAPPIKLTDQLGHPLPGRESLANEAKQMAATSGQAQGSAVTSDQYVSDPTKFAAKPTDVNKWTPTLTMPENYVPKNISKTFQVNPQTGKQAEGSVQITEQAQNRVNTMEAKASAAQDARLQLNTLIQQFDAIPQGGWTSSGTGNAQRMEILGKVNGLLDVLGAPKIDVPSQGMFEAAGKGTFLLGTKVANSIGTREPGYIVGQAVKSQPGTEMSKKGIDIVTSSMLAQNDYEQDKAKFFRDYVSRFKTLEGADAAFEHYNPVQMYANRGLVNSISQPDKQKLTGFVEQYGSQYPGRTQQAIQAFEKEHGLGTAKLVLGR